METNDFTPFAALSIGQAKEMITSIVVKAISDIKQRAQSSLKPESELMDADGTIRFLKEQGLPMTKATLYGNTSKKTIPFKRIGKRIVFSRKELLQWLESRTTRSETKSDAALRLSENARKR